MDFRDQILKSIENEVRIIKHLYSKLPEGSNEFRPIEGMRSVNELLDYLTWTGAGSIASYVNKDANTNSHTILNEYKERARKFSNARFEEAMDDQMNIIRDLMKNLSDEDLKNNNATVIWGETMKLGEAILNTSFKYFVAYRMQLFLYAKMAGATQLNTANCWIGMDPGSNN